ncbi:transporter substrate-binding domain-containing protein [Ideonella sp.]|uniref:substrate-binding periplasmic protein n=1 Tax=Ideonella sp. TaxID=1929293 RepID=UPI002B476F64|nr:transporter substrate-binding domain-containing protein [Ideonella sp.]HJV70013.1 transporter substrate-binding domain-containing protein [Ideonella sp.]
MFRRPFALLVLTMSALAAPAIRAEPIQIVTEDSSYTYLQGGKVAGPATEIVEATLKRAGLSDYRIALYPWARAYDMALQEPNTLIFLIARTPAREAQFKWAGEFMRIEYHLYKLRSRHDVTVRNLDDARQYAVGVMRDDVRQQYLQSRGFDKLVVSARNADSLRMLLERKVHLLPLPENDVIRFCKEANVDPAALEKVLTLSEMTTGIYMAYSHSTPNETVARTRAAFDRLKADGTVARLMNSRP